MKWVVFIITTCMLFFIVIFKITGTFLSREALVRQNSPAELFYDNHQNLHKKYQTFVLGDSRVKQWTDLDSDSILKWGAPRATSEEIVYSFLPYARDAKFDTIIIQYGINDVKALGYGAQDQDVDKCVKQVLGVTELLFKNVRESNPNCEIIIIGVISPQSISGSRKLFWNERVKEAIKLINQGFHKLSEENDYYYLGDNILNFSKEDFINDLHFSASGYKKLNEKLFKQ